MAANCQVDDTNNAFIARIKVLDSTAVIAIGSAEATGSATVCGTSALLCCVVTKVDAIITAQQTKIKKAFTDFGSKAATIGGLYAKYALLTNGTIGTATPAATLGAAATADLSGATATEFAGLGNYTSAAYVADYTLFAKDLPDCYAKYSELLGKIACSGCANVAPASLPHPWVLANGGPIEFKVATSNALAEKCARVWNFMWKTGWFVQTVAYLNSKKGTGYTYSAPALNTLIYQSTVTTGTYPVSIANINTAFTNCAADTSVGTCTAVNKGVLTQAFSEFFGDATSTGVGRSTVTIIGATNYYSNAARRVLPATSGVVVVDDTNGVDFNAATTGWTVTAPITLTAAADMTTWSAGYVAAGASSSSSSSAGSTTKNAKVVIGTILSALFAIAFLN